MYLSYVKTTKKQINKKEKKENKTINLNIISLEYCMTSDGVLYENLIWIDFKSNGLNLAWIFFSDIVSKLP